MLVSVVFNVATHLSYFKNSFCKLWTNSILRRQFAADSSSALFQWGKNTQF
jgi:hypothetical protein